MYEPLEDSHLLEKYVAKYSKGKVLDVGTGSGIQAITAMQNSEDVTAVDINEECVEFVKKKGVKSKKSNLFSKVKGKFDTIIFNPPYLPLDVLEDEESRLNTTGGKFGYEIIGRFFSEVGKYLKKDGVVLIVFSSLTNKKKVDKLITKNKFKFELLEILKVPDEELYCYLVKM
ncbi:methyltransferase [archaeon]|nr:methyltransferase [archaeon]